jgi:hypothetical protein
MPNQSFENKEERKGKEEKRVFFVDMHCSFGGLVFLA